MAENPPEIDFLSALAPSRLAIVAAMSVLGAALGFGVGHLFLRTYEARAVLRVATVGMFGPALPIAEVKARAESKSNLRTLLKDLADEDPTKDVARYKVLAENDGAVDNPVVTIVVTGPDLARVSTLCTRITDGLVVVTHDAYEKSLKEQNERLAKAGAMKPDAADPAARAASAEQEKWVGDAASLRIASRSLVSSHDSEVLDLPFGSEAPAKKLLLAALGAFVGMLVGLSLALRPARGSA